MLNTRESKPVILSTKQKKINEAKSRNNLKPEDIVSNHSQATLISKCSGQTESSKNTKCMLNNIEEGGIKQIGQRTGQEREASQYKNPPVLKTKYQKDFSYTSSKTVRANLSRAVDECFFYLDNYDNNGESIKLENIKKLSSIPKKLTQTAPISTSNSSDKTKSSIFITPSAEISLNNLPKESTKTKQTKNQHKQPKTKIEQFPNNDLNPDQHNNFLNDNEAIKAENSKSKLLF